MKQFDRREIRRERSTWEYGISAILYSVLTDLFRAKHAEFIEDIYAP